MHQTVPVDESGY